MAGNDSMTEAEGRKKVFELVKDVQVSMLTTFSPDGFLHARPMVARVHEADGDFWFFSDRHSEKIPEINADPRVALCYSEPSDQNYVSVSGTASVVQDRAKIRELWSEPMRTWFPKGPDDPNLTLIRVKAERAQFWDAPSSAIVYAYGYVKARLTGTPPNPGEEGKVRL